MGVLLWQDLASMHWREAVLHFQLGLIVKDP
jgi:hypothetical protein